MRYFSHFSGIGGVELGIQKAIRAINLRSIQQENSKRPKTQHCLADELGGWECVGYSEINKYAIQIYKRHFPKCKNYGDATRIIPEKLPDFDLFTFGWPCQDNSIAGEHKGQRADTRSGLLFEAVRILRAKKPKYFIAENVEGLFSVNESRDFYTTIEMFADAGYDCQWQVLNTSWFLPQNRKRIYFVGHIRGQCRPEIFPIETTSETYSESDEGGSEIPSTGQSSQSGKGQTKHSGRDTRKHIPSTLDANYGKGWRDHGQRTMIQIGQVGKKDNMGQRIYDPKGISCSIRSQGGGQGAKTGLYVIKKHRKNEIRNHKQICPTLTESHEHYGEANVPMIAVPLKYLNRNQRKYQGKYSFTIDGMNTGGIMKNMKIRRLTPVECERLQGFPDGWTEWGIDENGKKVKISDTQRYRTLGNAVTTDVVEEIVKKLIQNL